MTSAVGPDGPFSRDVVASVATEYGLSPERLTSLIERHQRSMHDLPGVAELVYEWRKHFDGAVLDRTDATYYLSVPEAVWAEFGESLDASDDETAALVAVHRLVVSRRGDAPDGPRDGHAFVVVDRRARDE